MKSFSPLNKERNPVCNSGRNDEVDAVKIGAVRLPVFFIPRDYAALAIAPFHEAHRAGTLMGGGSKPSP